MAWQDTVATLRALVIGGFLWVAISTWRQYLQRRVRRPQNLLARYGPWAVVTGATGGIGLQFVEVLAAQGFSVVITARRLEELSAIAEKTKRKYDVQIMCVATDLATPEGQAQLAQALEGVDVGLLVHNAGVGYVGALAEQDTARLVSLVQLNCLAPLTLTSRLLPAMRRRPRSGIVFVSSLAGYQPLPLHATYAASKAFLSCLGTSLWDELRSERVDVIVTEPGSVATAFGQASGTVTGRGTSPYAVVSETLAALGTGPAVSPGSLFAWLRSCLASMLPRRWIAPLGRKRQQRLMAPAAAPQPATQPATQPAPQPAPQVNKQ